MLAVEDSQADTPGNDVLQDMQLLLRTSARMYMCLTRETLAAFGRVGEMSVRYGLRAYGAWRGSEMQQAHHALGRPIDMNTLISCWDNASVYIIKDDMQVEERNNPNDVRYDVHFCPASETWKEADFHQWGHVYCDEFHQACAAGYHPDGHVVIPINLMKGDDHCRFEWIIPGGSPKLDLGAPTPLGLKLAADYEAKSEAEAAIKALKRCNRLLGGRYTASVKPLIAQFGGQGEEAVRAGMRSWGRLRGKVLRALHEEKGLPINLQTLMSRHDLPYATVWETDEVISSKDRFVTDIHWTPQDDVWQDLDAAELGAIWYEETYRALLDEYLPGAQLSWPKLQCRGDRVTRLEMDATSVF